jgi:hypothetical protein
VGHLESKSINDLEKDETLLKSIKQQNEKQKEHAKLMVARLLLCLCYFLSQQFSLSNQH